MEPTVVSGPSVAAPSSGLRLAPALGWGGSCLLVFHGAYASDQGWLAFIFPFLLVPLVRLASGRAALYGGLALGLGLYGPQLGFFWTIFGFPAVVLWLVLAAWIAVFLLIGSRVRRWMPGPGPGLGLALAVLWTGLEYFRCELYYLHFSWLTPGMALAKGTPMAALSFAGVHGTTLLAFLAAGWVWFGRLPLRILGAALGLALAVWNQVPSPPPPSDRLLHVAGAQTEGAREDELPRILDQVLAQHPSAQLMLLPEYALEGMPGHHLLEWCRLRKRHLVVGGRVDLGNRRFRNTAFVIDRLGQIVFRQTKSIPIQFFDDGEPATEQGLWPSPWGPLGIAICYDLSYTRVIDELVRLGAVGLVIPTMDAWTWGAHQHALHARIAPLRAAEYRIPILRCASSGVSQLVQAGGLVTASAPMSDTVQIFGGDIKLGGQGSLPWDRWIAPLCAVASLLTSVVLAARPLLRPISHQPLFR